MRVVPVRRGFGFGHLVEHSGHFLSIIKVLPLVIKFQYYPDDLQDLLQKSSNVNVHSQGDNIQSKTAECVSPSPCQQTAQQTTAWHLSAVPHMPHAGRLEKEGHSICKSAI